MDPVYQYNHVQNKCTVLKKTQSSVCGLQWASRHATKAWGRLAPGPSFLALLNHSELNLHCPRAHLSLRIFQPF